MRSISFFQYSKQILWLLALMFFASSFVAATSGCVRRRMTVRSNPPGATVYMDGKEIGKTPFSTNFDFYGKREFRLVKDGYETKTQLVPICAPWYQWIGFDFVSEVLLPGTLTDHKSIDFEMQPDRIVPRHELVGRAEDLRRTAHSEGTLRVDENARISPPAQSMYQGGSVIPYQSSELPSINSASNPATTWIPNREP
ncbi:MAG: PEGA domain-containing protein [Thermoguttaceae bacterium]